MLREGPRRLSARYETCEEDFRRRLDNAGDRTELACSNRRQNVHRRDRNTW